MLTVRMLSALLVLAIWALIPATSCGAEEKMAASLDETLAWLKKLPVMSRSAISPKNEKDCFQKLTVADLKTLKELHLGGHLVGPDGKLGAHISMPADDFHYLSALPALEKLDFMENDLGDAAMVHVGKIETLTFLGFGDHTVTDAGVKYLVNLKNLTELIIGFPDKSKGGGLSDAGLVDIAKLTNLEKLWLNGNIKLTDAGLVSLEALTKLKELNLINTGVTAAGVAKLQKALPNCKIQFGKK